MYSIGWKDDCLPSQKRKTDNNEAPLEKKAKRVDDENPKRHKPKFLRVNLPEHAITHWAGSELEQQLLGLTSKVRLAVNGAVKYGELAGGTRVSLSGFERIVDEDGVNQHYSFWLNKLRELPKKSAYLEISLAKIANREAELAFVA